MSKLTTPSGTRGVAYVRVSGDKQDSASQRASIRRWLAQHGVQVGVWYEDVGSRHEAYKRPEFQRLMAAVRADEIDWVVVDSKDRFGTRDSYEFGRFASELRDNDVELWSVAAGCLTDSDYATEILTAVDSVRSRDEQLERSRRAVRGMVQVWESGRYNGAYPPYGYDVACLGPDGRERWRVVFEGHGKRAKVLPDGRRERYDGKANFPARDQGDRLELAVSADPKRVEVVRQVFEWFTTESITYGGIAARLNALGADPLYSEAWYGNRVIGILRNPAVLVGKPVGNKQGHGSFFSLRGGKLTPAPTRRGRALNYRPHDEADFVYPKEWGEGIVDRRTWELAQAKMKGAHKTRRSPRSPDLWLGQFLYCGRCGRRMTGWTQKTHKREPHSYVCGTFRRFGAANAAGCRLHRVHHGAMAALVARFLADADRKLAEVLAAPPTGGPDGPDGPDDFEGAPGSAEDSLDRSRLAYCRLVNRLWRTVQKWGVPAPDGRPWAADALADAYRAHAPQHQSAERAELAALRRRYEEATERYLELPHRARAVVRGKLDELESQIAALEERLRPLDEKVGELREELAAAQDRVRAAREACQGAGNRQKAQALAGVLARIVCHFEHYQSVPKKRQTAGQKERAAGTDRSRLERAVFEPLAGAAVEVRPEFRTETVGNRRSSSVSSTDRSAPRSRSSSAIR